jgi:2-hydroxy-6-oxonona-2,4-dienedioate hydrolase
MHLEKRSDLCSRICPGSSEIIFGAENHGVSTRGFLAQFDDPARNMELMCIPTSQLTQKRTGADSRSSIPASHPCMGSCFQRSLTVKNMNKSEDLVSECRSSWVTGRLYRTFHLSNGQGTSIVLLHGAGGEGSLMVDLIAALRKNYYVAAPDMLGHGRTNGPARFYSIRGYVEWLDAYIEAMGRGSIQLLGHSLGGAVALRYAIEHPEKVERLILVNAISLGLPSLRSTLLLLRGVFSWDKERTNRLIGKVIFFEGGSRHQDLVDRYLTGDVKIPQGLKGFLRIFSRSWRLAWPISDRALRKTRVPVLILWGKEDAYFSILHAERALRLIQDCTVVPILGAGHVPFLEEPAECIEALQRFIS